MKTLFIHRITLLFILMLGWMSAKGQQQLEVPGDNFSLEGALEIFKNAASPEEFERMLNDPEARVNNLDLNGDGYIDYIRVIDMYEGNVHTFVLQAAISEYESQDIAIITLEKLANGKAILQITGDADIYGVETIIEPTTEVRTYAGANRSRVIVNVWAWPMVRYVYGPYYNVWVSPWGWSYRPYWWSPWRPVFYYDYYAYWWPYRSYYSVCYTHRVVYAHNMYWPHRTTSEIVYNHHHHRIREYRSTYIDREGYHQPRESRYSSRQSNNVRYSPDGRIVSNANSQIVSRSASRSTVDQDRTSVRSESGNTVQGSRQATRDNAQRYSDNYNARTSTERSTGSADLRRSEGNSTIQRSARISSGNATMRSSSGSTGVQRSGSGSNYGANSRISNGSANVQGSSSRTFGNAKVQSSSGRTYGNANVQRSQTGSGNNSSFSRPTSNVNTRSSQNNSSGNTSFRSSSRSSSAGNSISSGSRSQGSSSRSSGNSNSRSSGSSSQGNRGRH